MVNIRVALCGRGGCGKTTLARQLADELGVMKISEVVRIVARLMEIERIDWALRDGERIALQAATMQYQLLLEGLYAGSGFVADRSVYDAYEYARATMFGRQDHAIARLHRLTQTRLGFSWRPYTHMIYVPPFSEEPVEDDGFRLCGSIAEVVEDRVAMAMARRCQYHLKETTVEGRMAELRRIVQTTEATRGDC